MRLDLDKLSHLESKYSTSPIALSTLQSAVNEFFYPTSESLPGSTLPGGVTMKQTVVINSLTKMGILIKDK